MAYPGPEVIKLFFMLNSAEHEILTAHIKLKYRQIKKFLALSLSYVVFIMLKNVKMPTTREPRAKMCPVKYM